MQTPLARTPKKLPELVIKRKPASIYDSQFEDWESVGYDADPSIKADVAI
ncbi:thymidylate synthase [Klebsiella quasipneumoniae]|nr:thymidylate synthase [Klebsiella quasipneumoniae]MDP1098055.1 thymidylate synthase [Klebsiella quasipneumoniae]